MPPIRPITCFNMRDRMERLVLLPFRAGCISESSIPVVVQHTKRSRLDTNSTPTRTRQEGKKDEEEVGCLDDKESLQGENLKTILLRFQKLFKNIKNFSQLFVYKDELEQDIGMEIGLPTDVKHVTHIGLDGCASSIFSKDWNNLAEPELINLHSFPLTELEFAIKAQTETHNVRSLLETKCNSNDDAVAQ